MSGSIRAPDRAERVLTISTRLPGSKTNRLSSSSTQLVLQRRDGGHEEIRSPGWDDKVLRFLEGASDIACWVVRNRFVRCSRLRLSIHGVLTDYRIEANLDHRTVRMLL